MKNKNRKIRTYTKFNLELYLRVLQARDMPFNRFTNLSIK